MSHEVDERAPNSTPEDNEAAEAEQKMYEDSEEGAYDSQESGGTRGGGAKGNDDQPTETPLPESEGKPGVIVPGFPPKIEFKGCGEFKVS